MFQLLYHYWIRFWNYIYPPRKTEIYLRPLDAREIQYYSKYRWYSLDIVDIRSISLIVFEILHDLASIQFFNLWIFYFLAWMSVIEYVNRAKTHFLRSKYLFRGLKDQNTRTKMSKHDDFWKTSTKQRFHDQGLPRPES